MSARFDSLGTVTVILLVVAGALAVGMWHVPVIQRNERMRKELLRIETATQVEDQLNRCLKATVEANRNDPRVVERLAREHLGYAKKDEVVIRFESPAKTNRKEAVAQP